MMEAGKQAVLASKEICIQVWDGKEHFSIVLKEEESILDALQRERRGYAAVCGKQGRCGKCRIRVVSGRLPLTKEDAACFDQAELEEGWRLSCRARPTEDCRIELFFGEQEFEVLSEGGALETAESGRGEAEDSIMKGTYGIAIDIGTTTLAARLLALPKGQALSAAVSLNHQRAYGADVISRIQASNEGKKEELQELIRADLLSLIEDLLDKAGVKPELVSRISIAGNTTMGHLLMGYSCEELGRLPFAPVNIERITGDAKMILGQNSPCGLSNPHLKVELLPGFSVFVGADIAAGLLSCGFDRKEKVSLFLDLGTNGEMALGNKERIYTASTAAGPAFEGGSILWGSGSIPGAICHVKIDQKGKARVETIGNRPPVSICGTGVIETAAELLRRGLMDETGKLKDIYEEEGYPLAETPQGETIRLTQRDIRELQLAKAAIQAGQETLMELYGIRAEELEHIYLAGGFGYQLDLEKAAAIGLFPPDLLERVRPAGNASLAGAELTLTEESAFERAELLRRASREISLAATKEFSEKYMNAMVFGNIAELE